MNREEYIAIKNEEVSWELIGKIIRRLMKSSNVFGNKNRITRKVEDMSNRGKLQNGEGDNGKRWVNRYSPLLYIDRRKLS